MDLSSSNMNTDFFSFVNVQHGESNNIINNPESSFQFYLAQKINSLDQENFQDIVDMMPLEPDYFENNQMLEIDFNAIDSSAIDKLVSYFEDDDKSIEPENQEQILESILKQNQMAPQMVNEPQVKVESFNDHQQGNHQHNNNCCNFLKHSMDIVKTSSLEVMRTTSLEQVRKRMDSFVKPDPVSNNDIKKRMLSDFIVLNEDETPAKKQKTEDQQPQPMAPFSLSNLDDKFKISVVVYKIQKTAETQKPFICDACGSHFSDSSNLMQHLRTHTKEKPYECKDCNKYFSHTATLKEHRRIHTGEKPFECEICQKRFSQGSNFKRHQRVHTQQKPFVCEEPGCGKEFAQSANLKQHIAKNHKK